MDNLVILVAVESESSHVLLWLIPDVDSRSLQTRAKGAEGLQRLEPVDRVQLVDREECVWIIASPVMVEGRYDVVIILEHLQFDLQRMQSSHGARYASPHRRFGYLVLSDSLPCDCSSVQARRGMLNGDMLDACQSWPGDMPKKGVVDREGFVEDDGDVAVETFGRLIVALLARE